MTAWRVATLSVTVFVFYFVVIAADDNGTCKTPAPSPSVATEKRLMDCLMKSYNQDVRPAHNVSDVVTVHFDMTYIHIVSLNTKSNTLRSKSWLQKSWVDPQLKWDPKNFGNIDTIRIPAKKIWTPDIVLYNSLDVGGETVVDTLAVVKSNGTVMWTPHEILTSHCPMRMRHFPNDQQTCHLVYGSWTYDNTQLKLKLKTQPNPKFLFGDQLEDENWHVSQLTATPHDAQINGGAEFSNVLYTLVISRSSPYYGETLLLPAILFSILTMAMFFIPAATGERLLYGVGLLLVSVFQLRNVEAAVPGDTGQVPLVVVYLAFDQVMLTAGIVLSIVVYNCHYRNVKRGSVPGCLKTVFLGRLSRLLCVPAERYTRLPLNLDDAELDLTPFPHDTDPPATTDAAPADDKDRALEATLDDIRKYLRICATHATSGGETGSHHQVVLNEWIQLARVIDRLLFAIFLTITFLTLVLGSGFH